MNENKSINQSIYQIKVRENRKGSEEWRIQIHWLHLAHKTQDEATNKTKQKLKKKHNAEN